MRESERERELADCYRLRSVRKSATTRSKGHRDTSERGHSSLERTTLG